MWLKPSHSGILYLLALPFHVCYSYAITSRKPYPLMIEDGIGKHRNSVGDVCVFITHIECYIVKNVLRIILFVSVMNYHVKNLRKYTFIKNSSFYKTLYGYTTTLSIL